MVRNDYYTEIAQFMSFMDGIEYPRNDNSHVFPQERLLEITDLDVVSYFNFKAYHNAGMVHAYVGQKLLKSNTSLNFQ